MTMKTILAAIVVTLGLMSAVLPAQADPYDGYPQWARDAFTRANHWPDRAFENAIAATEPGRAPAQAGIMAGSVSSALHPIA
jgi:hypothetical protein